MKKILIIISVIFCSCTGELTQRNIDAKPFLVFQTANISVYKIKVDTTWYLVSEKHNGGIHTIPIK